ncbi:MAG: histone deacetylase [Spirochaetes bacterium]|nr:histone deacetylase [Spirochaetota bacterium]
MSEKRFDFQDLEEIDFADELPAATHFSADKKLFLQTYTEGELWQALERAQIIAELKARGYFPVKLEVEFLTERDHRFYLVYAGEKILHMRLRLSYFKLHRHPLMPVMRMLYIDWLQTRHVKRRHQDESRLFPGQDVPGLGIFNRIDHFLRDLVVATRAYGGFNIPEYFHDALLFHRAFTFYDPEREAFFRALLRDLKGHGAREISKALTAGRIRNAKGEAVEWHGGEMLIFTHKPYAETVFNDRFRRDVERKMREWKFTLYELA